MKPQCQEYPQKHETLMARIPSRTWNPNVKNTLKKHETLMHFLKGKEEKKRGAREKAHLCLQKLQLPHALQV